MAVVRIVAARLAARVGHLRRGRNPVHAAGGTGAGTWQSAGGEMLKCLHASRKWAARSTCTTAPRGRVKRSWRKPLASNNSPKRTRHSPNSALTASSHWPRVTSHFSLPITSCGSMPIQHNRTGRALAVAIQSLYRFQGINAVGAPTQSVVGLLAI